ncbi:MAG: hypothetical protein JGK17_32080 [Microcoleus sp. PH2017_10_PVI_O_A]|uniref:hypothetical protein n=2 Tax=unclassified Microcoleus TaxID=2642155 RepID=UPI001D6F1211|nr:MULTISPECIES: hypothetical protein [unclassified Microcoleus]TAE94155.1 MAG: hypothetical protein EAZ79_24225 [Oscillatoriales cyanobacterium]MCC3410092.1 hypothetical protein [Microcoleus sp. PH2017_10_PVI_O_A]MCC3464354.1 hypothetical protein [Microcoleus sp. PH2017_11_PCY_U_A]MCC3482694.1 hypothetical protein [Microcoleus sp. PH2017_12_PCY_D_A]MCC3563679.1 hypothetical protein [Microcoleus sp. PH2017_27_LUM_O_A]
MAKPRNIQRRPKLTQKGRLLDNQQISKNIDNWVETEFQDELRMTAFLDVNTRRQIRLGTGVGDMEVFNEEFNNGFSGTSQLSTSQQKGKKGSQAFGEPWKNRPKLKKISQEYKIGYRPPSKQ